MAREGAVVTLRRGYSEAFAAQESAMRELVMATVHRVLDVVERGEPIATHGWGLVQVSGAEYDAMCSRLRQVRDAYQRAASEEAPR